MTLTAKFHSLCVKKSETEHLEIRSRELESEILEWSESNIFPRLRQPAFKDRKAAIVAMSGYDLTSDNLPTDRAGELLKPPSHSGNLPVWIMKNFLY